MTEKQKKKLVADQEADFLLAFYGKGSPTRLDRRASAISAGYTPRMAMWNANRLLKKYEEAGFRECAETLGITNANLAVMFREVLETSKGKDAISALRLALANRGEATDNRDAPRGVTVTGPTILYVGEIPDSLRNTRKIPPAAQPELPPAAAPELPPAPELEGEVVSPASEADTVDVGASKVESAPAEDVRRLKPGDFAGPNRGDVGN
jgi:hypothetical protein